MIFRSTTVASFDHLKYELPRMGTEMGTGIASLQEALQVVGSGEHWSGTVQQGYDVFGIPHGGYMAALAAQAVLHAADVPDLFTVTTHFLRKAAFAPINFEVRRVGASRRFATWSATATQGDQVVLTALASVGDRSQFEGPQWSSVQPPEIPPSALTPSASARKPPAPSIAQIFNLRLDQRTVPYLEGQTADKAIIQAIAEPESTDQLAALIACDVTPPAGWNALGSRGWVPTLELTAHVRARPAPGAMCVQVESRFVSMGFLDEDALVFDSRGELVLQSRQLARWTNT